MISEEKLLRLKTRRDIYNLILEYPGLHLREISRRINISIGSIRHHLNYLKKNELINSKVYRRFTRYYATQKVGKRDKELLNLFRQEIPCKIVLLLLCTGPGYIYKKKGASGEFDPAIFVRTYSKKELVELTRYWKKSTAELFHLQKHRTTINFHINKLFDVGLIEKVIVGRKTKYKLKDENMIWAFFIRYQKALSNQLINRMMVWQDDGIQKRLDAMIEIFFEIFPHPYHV